MSNATSPSPRIFIHYHYNGSSGGGSDDDDYYFDSRNHNHNHSDDDDDDSAALAVGLVLIVLSMAFCLIFLHQFDNITADPEELARNHRERRRRRGDYELPSTLVSSSSSGTNDKDAAKAKVNIYQWKSNPELDVDDGATVQTHCSHESEEDPDASVVHSDKNAPQDVIEEIDLEEQVDGLVIPKQQPQPQDVECPICLCEFEEGDQVCQSKNPQCCGHTFHLHCLGEWLWDHEECPLCRSEFLVPVNDDENATAAASQLKDAVIDSEEDATRIITTTASGMTASPLRFGDV